MSTNQVDGHTTGLLSWDEVILILNLDGRYLILQDSENKEWMVFH